MRRYFNLNDYLKEKYGEKIGKLSLDAGFSCPNRDGKLSFDGCVFCSEKGSGEFTSFGIDLKSQMISQKEIVQKKWNNKKFIAYFQNFTNTYGDIDYLKKIYNEVLEYKDVVGISIATRADCLDNEVLNILEELSKKTDLWIEIGMQSTKKETIDYINRGYSHAYLDEKLKELRSREIKYLLHVIFGLPNETEEDMMNSIKYVNSSNAFGVKFHSLYIQNDSNIYKDYLDQNFKLLTKDEYTDLVVKAISILNNDIVIHRITGDGDKKKLVAPEWSADKLSVIGEINRKLKENNIFQGCKL